MRCIDMKAAASVALLLLSSTSSFAQPQQAASQPAGNGSQVGGQAAGTPLATPQTGNQTAPATQNGLPQLPEPKLTEPFDLRDTAKNYSRLKTHLFRSGFYGPFAPYTATNVPEPRLSNTPRLNDLLRDGKLYLGLDDAVTLALENNYDIAIARLNLDIADTDILRTEAGALFRGVSTGLVANTLGGQTSTITGGGGPGGTSSASGGAGTGANGLVLSTNGGGPLPYSFDPLITATGQYEDLTTQEPSNFLTGTNQLLTRTLTANLGYTQGFSTGTQFAVTFDNSRQTTSSPRSSYSPQLTTNLRLQLTQHLLQGFGTRINRRFIVEAKNNRRITDSAFRQQVIYTVTQIESIYWSLVSAYEDVAAKERALAQSSQLAADNRKQLEIGTLAPLDVVNSDAAVATDKQALITSQSNLEYQQLLMKQAISRNLNDPNLSNAPVIPTDRVSLERLPEEDLQTDDLVRQAFQDNPQLEQAALAQQNNEVTIRGEKNGLLPIIDGFAFYGSTTLGGSQNPALRCSDPTTFATAPCTPTNGGVTNTGYFNTIGNLFNGTAPDYGVGVNLQIPLRNRVAQADQARAQLEYRQTQMRLQQLYTQIRIQVINAQFALTNDRANVQAAQTTRDYNAQAVDAEQKKYKLGASTSTAVLGTERTLATGENNLISATAAYARDRASLEQILANTLDKYGISLVDAATGTVTQKPNIPGLTAPQPPAPPKPLTATPPPPIQ